MIYEVVDDIIVEDNRRHTCPEETFSLHTSHAKAEKKSYRRKATS